MNSAIRSAGQFYQLGRGSSGPPYFTITTLSCSGLESQLLDCIFSASASPCYSGPGVRCYGKQRYSQGIWKWYTSNTNSIHFSFLAVNSGCGEGDIRLAGGETMMQGRVEVCHNQTWWAVIASYYWDLRDATVVCRHLHYPANCKHCNKQVSKLHLAAQMILCCIQG